MGKRVSKTLDIFFKATDVLNASKKQAWKVYTSLGINVAMLPFMTALEQIRLQLANKFCYTILVSRVQYQVPVYLEMILFT